MPQRYVEKHKRRSKKCKNVCFVAYFNSMLIHDLELQKKPLANWQRALSTIYSMFYSFGLVSSPAIESRIEVSAIMFLYFI
jgi:hypothetical protein